MFWSPASSWHIDNIPTRGGGKTQTMRNWIRDKFGSNRVRTNPRQEERLAPIAPAPIQGLHAADWINNGTLAGTYAGLTRDPRYTIMWGPSIGTATTYTSYWTEYLVTSGPPSPPAWPSKIRVPEGM